MGAVGSTFGRNLKPGYRARAVRHAERGDRRAKAAASRHVPSGALAQHPGGRVDPVPGARLGNHARHPLGKDDIVVPLPNGMKWTSKVGGSEESVMRIAGNEVRGDAGGKRPPIFFGNAASHWWDGSEVYGPNSEKAMKLRGRRQDQAREQSPAGRCRGLRAHRLQRKLVARPQRLAHAVCPRAQSVVRRTQGALRQLGRRAHLSHGAADRLGADRQDPHRRMDAGDPGDQRRSKSACRATGTARPPTTG